MLEYIVIELVNFNVNLDTVASHDERIIKVMSAERERSLVSGVRMKAKQSRISS